MEYVIGVILTLAVAAFAAVIGFDRERAFYPTVLIGAMQRCSSLWLGLPLR
jgi:hypothetical protein